MYVLLMILIILVILLVLLSVNEKFQDSNNGYIKACNEINTKRLLLKQYMRNLRTPVQDLSGLLLTGIDVKKENMTYQNKYTDSCINNLTAECIKLASVDAGVFAALPDIDIFYQNLLIGGYDLDALLQQLNFYSKLLNCPRVPDSNATFDVSDTEIDMDRDIGVIDTVGLSYELENLSPYYLSPDVVQFLLRFLISQEQLKNLRFTSADYVNQSSSIMNTIKPYYT
jgi:hypothetical protein